MKIKRHEIKQNTPIRIDNNKSNIRIPCVKIQRGFRLVYYLSEDRVLKNDFFLIKDPMVTNKTPNILKKLKPDVLTLHPFFFVDNYIV